MRPVVLLSVFLVVSCCREVLSAELIRQQPSQDFVKLTSSRKQIAKRRFRRDVKYQDDPDSVNTNKEGPCNDPTTQAGHGIKKMPVSKLRRANCCIDEDSKIAKVIFCVFSALVSNIDCSFSFSGCLRTKQNLVSQ